MSTSGDRRPRRPVRLPTGRLTASSGTGPDSTASTPAPPDRRRRAAEATWAAVSRTVPANRVSIESRPFAYGVHHGGSSLRTCWRDAVAVRRRRARAPRMRSGRPSTANIATSSSAAALGSLPIRYASARSTLPSASRTYWNGSAASRQLASRVNSAAWRSARCGLCGTCARSSSARTPRVAASAWKTSASRGDHDTASCPRHPPAEVDVVAEQREPRVEAPSRFQVAAYEHPRAAHREHVTLRVVLTLVGLADLDTGLAVAGAGDR